MTKVSNRKCVCICHEDGFTDTFIQAHSKYYCVLKIYEDFTGETKIVGLTEDDLFHILDTKTANEIMYALYSDINKHSST